MVLTMAMLSCPALLLNDQAVCPLRVHPLLDALTRAWLYASSMLENPTIATADFDPRRAARALYWQGWRISSVARHLNLKRATVEAWKQRDEWDKATPIERIETCIETRLVALISKQEKDGRDFKEIDLLMRQMGQSARVQKYDQTGKESDLNPKLERSSAQRKKGGSNEFSEADVEKMREAFLDSLFDYQKVWYRQGDRRTRNILKSRQIGATWYFAREALLDALETGRNQIFLSASRAQAQVFKQYIVQFAKEVCDVEMRGDPMVLPNGAHLYFLGTNARTAQSYHGNFYFDEYFWVPKFKELNTVASGMAMHKKWRKTYFSTPSAMSHSAYPFWDGSHFNRGREKSKHIRLDVSHTALAEGRQCEDGQWRQIVTIEDARSAGCDLFDLDKLRMEYSAEEYANLLMCQFIDDTASIFKFADLQRCMVDPWEQWEDVKFLAMRPFANRPVWVGYDPALSGDSAGCIVLAPPAVPGGKFRVLAKHQWRGMDFEAQARSIKEICAQYNVTYMAIDTTGIGAGVHQLVKQFYPAVVSLQYSPEVKGRLVLKGLSVVGNNRLEFDAGWTDLAAAFLAIRKTVTASGRQITYAAGYSQEIGHADLAWACLHAMGNEPLEGGTAANTSILEIYA